MAYCKIPVAVVKAGPTPCSGNPGNIVEIICTGCGTEGKVTFERIISSKNAAIEVTNLTKIYGDLVAVNNISFTVQMGKIFAFLGPNGAGKTTTVEMMDYIAAIQQWAAEYLSIEIPDPGEQLMIEA